jgi:hypothetical protein
MVIKQVVYVMVALANRVTTASRTRRTVVERSPTPGVSTRPGPRRTLDAVVDFLAHAATDPPPGVCADGVSRTRIVIG